MSYYLEFPASVYPLPTNIMAKPYAHISIGTRDISSLLPKLIPIPMLLHFAPALQKFLGPPEPADSLTNRILKPHQRLTFPQGSVGRYGVEDIIKRMMQIAGGYTPSLFKPPRPNLDAAVLVLEAWMIFGQKAVGSVQLRDYILSRLYAGPVDAYDIKAIWEHFHHDSDLAEAMISNVVENWANGELSDREKLMIMRYAQPKKELEERIFQANTEFQKKVEARKANRLRQFEWNGEVRTQQPLSARVKDTRELHIIPQSGRLIPNQSEQTASLDNDRASRESSVETVVHRPESSSNTGALVNDNKPINPRLLS
ncbi:hypothetical protein BU16DRAFT_21786 [Lophium mytilinum]|uniref:Uncharacterized protein n=1 Tax=Lophium mytilinum TaxID=390894 RepID=A0A6A6RGP6_9PEZI|nr:hypothetical protein BU16DRAFT_21786 [Lophium mytilinum]